MGIFGPVDLPRPVGVEQFRVVPLPGEDLAVGVVPLRVINKSVFGCKGCVKSYKRAELYVKFNEIA